MSPLLSPAMPRSNCHVCSGSHPAAVERKHGTWDMYRRICVLPAALPAQDQQSRIPWMEALRAWVHPAQQEALDAGDRVHVVLVPAALDEGRQARGVQGDLGVAATVRLQPRML